MPVPPHGHEALESDLGVIYLGDQGCVDWVLSRSSRQSSLTTFSLGVAQAAQASRSAASYWEHRNARAVSAAPMSNRTRSAQELQPLAIRIPRLAGGDHSAVQRGRRRATRSKPTRPNQPTPLRQLPGQECVDHRPPQLRLGMDQVVRRRRVLSIDRRVRLRDDGKRSLVDGIGNLPARTRLTQALCQWWSSSTMVAHG